MTFSLVARDDDGRTFGVATASKYLAVGATVPAVAAGVGALATQASTNVLFRDAGLRLLRQGRTAPRTVELLVAGDPGRTERQVAVVAATGPPGAWTGEGCSDVACHLVGDGVVAAGNLLADEAVLPAMLRASQGATGTLARRLLAGLAAGDAAGGDRRGRQSAALVVASGSGVLQLRTSARVDLRVDDHPAPVPELARLLDRHELLVGETDPAAVVPLRGEVAVRVEGLLAALGRTAGRLPARLQAWAGTENLEHRTLLDGLDPVLLDELERLAGRAPARAPGPPVPGSTS
ncbi:DUF1028 domain-containing protein [Cellulomonas marina]|uniref:DUF1028 domain-containing protein n=1 Tax=Cellulomonas marina TaxID=988821 RepID=UPI000B7CDED8|nr:DUF1028 domain-containing protein [Cellulomonas marina]